MLFTVPPVCRAELCVCEVKVGPGLAAAASLRERGAPGVFWSPAAWLSHCNPVSLCQERGTVVETFLTRGATLHFLPSQYQGWKR